MTISAYINPHASNTVSGYWRDELSKNFFRHDINIKEPDSLNSLHDELEQDKADGVESIFCLGGDGTVNTILQSIHGSDIDFYVIPTGTANDLATGLGLKRNIKMVSNLYRHHSLTDVDVIKVNDQCMITNGGIGFAPNISQKVNNLRLRYPMFKKLMKHTKSEIYNLLMVNELLTKKLRYYNLYVNSPDLPFWNKKIVAPLLLVNNQPFIAKNFRVAPTTKNNDGKFNVTIFTHTNKVSFAKTIAAIRLGRYPKNDPKLISFETDSLDVINLDHEPMPFLGDGEILSQAQEFKIRLSPDKQKVSSYDSSYEYSHAYDLDDIQMI